MTESSSQGPNDNLPSAMDSEVSLLFHCAAWRGLRESQVQVELSERHNCQKDQVLQQHIEELWAERVSREPWLFNGAKFRLHSFSLASPEGATSSSSNNTASVVLPQPPHLECANTEVTTLQSYRREDRNFYADNAGGLRGAVTQNTNAVEAQGVQEGNGDADVFCLTSNKHTTSTSSKMYPKSGYDNCQRESVSMGLAHDPLPCTRQQTHPLLTLRFGLTCYKDFLGTNWSSQAEQLRSRGEAEFRDPLALLAQPLGVGGVLSTCDGQVVLIRRSQKVAEAGGLLDIPGGHPEPKAVCERFGVMEHDDQISMSFLQQRRDAVVAELFSSVCAEIRDEVNVPLACLAEPVLMGVALNHTSAGRPSAEFFISCSLSSSQVQELYWRGGAEAHESTDIVFLSKQEMLQLNKDSPLWSDLCPSAKGAVLLYQLVMPDVDKSHLSMIQDHLTAKNRSR